MLPGTLASVVRAWAQEGAASPALGAGEPWCPRAERGVAGWMGPWLASFQGSGWGAYGSLEQPTGGACTLGKGPRSFWNDVWLPRERPGVPWSGWATSWACSLLPTSWVSSLPRPRVVRAGGGGLYGRLQTEDRAHGCRWCRGSGGRRAPSGTILSFFFSFAFFLFRAAPVAYGGFRLGVQWEL